MKVSKVSFKVKRVVETRDGKSFGLFGKKEGQSVFVRKNFFLNQGFKEEEVTVLFPKHVKVKADIVEYAKCDKFNNSELTAEKDGVISYENIELDFDDSLTKVRLKAAKRAKKLKITEIKTKNHEQETPKVHVPEEEGI